jgi:cyclopropane fatty-acyl-phospholipid synthase-like methyltransferase
MEKILEHAQQFIRRHPHDVRVERTFVYFTTHVVAPLNRQRLGALIQKTVELRAKLGREPRILDLACGGGLIANALALAGARVCGFDLDPDEVSLAREFTTLVGQRVIVDSVDLIDGPDWEKRAQQALGGPPDAIVMAYALHHLPRVEKFLDRLSAWVPPATLLWVNEENPHSPLFRLKHTVRTWILKDTETEWHRSYSSWAKLLQQRKWSVSLPQGYDPFPGWGRFFPKLSWSLVFQAERNP